MSLDHGLADHLPQVRSMHLTEVLAQGMTGLTGGAKRTLTTSNDIAISDNLLYLWDFAFYCSMSGNSMVFKLP